MIDSIVKYIIRFVDYWKYEKDKNYYIVQQE